jgi:hypothetical protein
VAQIPGTISQQRRTLTVVTFQQCRLAIGLGEDGSGEFVILDPFYNTEYHFGFSEEHKRKIIKELLGGIEIPQLDLPI